MNSFDRCGGKMTKGKTSGIYFKVTDKERSLIEQKMALAGKVDPIVKTKFSSKIR